MCRQSSIGVLVGEGDDLAEQFEALLAAHGIPPDGRDGVFDCHHYHLTAHEVLGVFAGAATPEPGGPDGWRVGMRPGDPLLLPGGTGHCCLYPRADLTAIRLHPATF